MVEIEGESTHLKPVGDVGIDLVYDANAVI